MVLNIKALTVLQTSCQPELTFVNKPLRLRRSLSRVVCKKHRRFLAAIRPVLTLLLMEQELRDETLKKVNDRMGGAKPPRIKS
jgi:hypothetical protein